MPAANVLRFAFTQPSWVEVRDKSGNIVFSQLNPGGTQKEVEGTPPFAVVMVRIEKGAWKLLPP